MPKRRDLLKLGGLGPLAFLPAAAAAPIPTAGRTPKDAKLTKEPFGDLLIFFEGSTDQLSSMTAGSLRLNAGMEPHPPHQHPEEEFLLITEGTGEVSLEGKISKVAPGSMLYCGGNKLHGIRNTGKVPMLFYFYKWKA
jgi:mannose-6-phosphate isomerase-like protein (cupin superfamily)